MPRFISIEILLMDFLAGEMLGFWEIRTWLKIHSILHQIYLLTQTFTCIKSKQQKPFHLATRNSQREKLSTFKGKQGEEMAKTQSYSVKSTKPGRRVRVDLL